MPNYGQRVPDFTLSTLDGEWNFQENWSGCDNYLFVNHADGYDYAAQLWDSDFEDFLEDSPPMFTTLCRMTRVLKKNKSVRFKKKPWMRSMI